MNELISSRGVEDLCLSDCAANSHDLSRIVSVEWQLCETILRLQQQELLRPRRNECKNKRGKTLFLLIFFSRTICEQNLIPSFSDFPLH